MYLRMQLVVLVYTTLSHLNGFNLAFDTGVYAVLGWFGFDLKWATLDRSTTVLEDTNWLAPDSFFKGKLHSNLQIIIFIKEKKS